MKNNLVIGLLGHRHAGKSTTWKRLFKKSLRTGDDIRKLYLTKTEYVEVFLVYGQSRKSLPLQKPLTSLLQ